VAFFTDLSTSATHHSANLHEQSPKIAMAQMVNASPEQTKMRQQQFANGFGNYFEEVTASMKSPVDSSTFWEPANSPSQLKVPSKLRESSMMLWRPGNQEDEEETLGLILFLVIL
jgi:hypothetical protein